MARASAGRRRSSSTYACSPAAKASRHGSPASRAAAVARSKWAQARGSRFMSMACHPASAEASARAGGELLAVPGAQGVAKVGLDLADVGVQLVRHGGGAEAAVQEPDVVGLALQDADDGGVDAAGRGDLPEQLDVLAGGSDRAARRRGGDLPGSQPEQDPGVVGHVQAVGDALEDLDVADLADAVDDFAHPALAQADRGADAHLAEAEVLPEQPEQRAHVSAAQGLADVGAFPEGGRDRRRVECAWTHSVPSIVAQPRRPCDWVRSAAYASSTVRTPSVMGS